MSRKVRGPQGPGRAVGPEAAESSGQQSIREQVEDSLFRRRKPTPLEDDDEEVQRLLERLDVYRKKLARLAGDDEDDYRLQLAVGPFPSIDREGVVFVGRDFLLTYAGELAAQVGALAHEIGHRPKRWDELKAGPKLSRTEGEELCRLEECRADSFAGYALSQLGLSPEPFCAFLEQLITHPHKIYVPVLVRQETIREAFHAGERRTVQLRKLFPEFARYTSAKLDFGQG